MMEYAVILDADMSFARQLRQALSHLRQVKVAVMPTPEDAQVAIMRQPQDWAFIPLEDACETAVLLQAVQPDIRIIVLLPHGQATVPDDCAALIHGTVDKSRLVEELSAVLATAVAPPATPHPTPPSPTPSPTTTIEPPETAVVIAALQQIELDRVMLAVIMGHATSYLAHWGDFSNMLARNIASFVGSEWVQLKPRVRVQFLYVEERTTDMMLYTHHIADDYFVTLVTLPEASLVELRQQMAPLVASLTTLLYQGTFAPADSVEAVADGHNSFALVWRPIRPLPAPIQTALPAVLERLAQTNGSHLSHVDVQPEYVHIVVSCPPRRDSSWAATLFKNGSEATIQQKFDVTAAIWGKGFYATESTRPLSPAELHLFLTA